MIKRNIIVYGDEKAASSKSKGDSSKTPAASLATPPNIDEIGKPRRLPEA